MLTLHDLEITRPSKMSSRVSSDLLTAERGVGGGVPLYGLYEYVPRDSVDRF